jgi:hypothetical protein
MMMIDAATISATPSMGWLKALRMNTSAHISNITAAITSEPRPLSPSTRYPNGLPGAVGGGPSSRFVLAS